MDIPDDISLSPEPRKNRSIYPSFFISIDSFTSSSRHTLQAAVHFHKLFFCLNNDSLVFLQPAARLIFGLGDRTWVFRHIFKFLCAISLCFDWQLQKIRIKCAIHIAFFIKICFPAIHYLLEALILAGVMHTIRGSRHVFSVYHCKVPFYILFYMIFHYQFSKRI